MPVDRFAVSALEFDRVPELVGRFLASPLGRNALAELEPFSSRASMDSALQQVREIAAWLGEGGRLPLVALSDSRAWLEAFRDGARQPTAVELAELSRALRSANRVRRVLASLEGYAALQQLGERLPDVAELHERLENTIDDKGEVLSSASLKLSRVREQIRSLERDVQVTLERLMRSANVQKYLQAPNVVWRNNRPVLQVKPEWRRQIRGILHDRSQTGQTVFVEPEQVVEIANKLGDRRAEERAEVQRVLAELLRELRAHVDDLVRTLRGLAWVDYTNARGRLVCELGFVVPTLAEPGCWKLREARHPLLLRALFEGTLTREAALASVVPLDLDLGDPYSMIVITGPNTGGKTVALKAVGLLTLMAQAGMPVPAASASLPFVDGVFADIGDEQAIEQSLSTFSSHLTRVGRALSDATGESLVLLDELGAGTDPEEGGAIGYALLEALQARRIATIASTHLGRLKDFAYEHDGVENGSMAFDPDELRPLFRLDIGIPGASQALHIARAVGIAEPILTRAREILGDRDTRLEEIIARVQRTRKAAEAHRREAEVTRQRTEGAAAELRQKVEEVDRREAWIREEAEHFVDEELRAARGLLIEPLKQFLNAPAPHDERAAGLIKLVEGLLGSSSLGRRRESYVADVKKGHVVYVPRFRRRCTVLKVDRKRRLLRVEVGGLKMEVSFDDVSWLQPLG